MIGLEYIFTLPDDYDMRTVRSRVAERGQLFDKLEGLYEKTFLISEKGAAGASGNSYAPFYLWTHSEAISNFLIDEKFKAVSEAFGRPSVKSWLPLYFSSGQARMAKPTFATKETVDIAPDTDLAQLRREEYKLHRQWAGQSEHHSSFIGLDPASWQIVRFALWTLPQEGLAASVQTFEVLHLSAPGLDPTYFASPC